MDYEIMFPDGSVTIAQVDSRGTLVGVHAQHARHAAHAEHAEHAPTPPPPAGEECWNDECALICMWPQCSDPELVAWRSGAERTGRSTPAPPVSTDRDGLSER